MSVLNQSKVAVECSLCIKPSDDQIFFLCTCGYRLCYFCWHRICTNENGFCPACRKHLANVRVAQRNLVFVVGLPMRLADADVLKKHEYFGKFGKIHKVVVNQTSYARSQGSSVSAYVTYQRQEDALRAIEAVNNIVLDGRTIKASLETKEYCSHFTRNQACPKPDGGKEESESFVNNLREIANIFHEINFRREIPIDEEFIRILSRLMVKTIKLFIEKHEEFETSRKCLVENLEKAQKELAEQKLDLDKCREKLELAEESKTELHLACSFFRKQYDELVQELEQQQVPYNVLDDSVVYMDLTLPPTDSEDSDIEE